MGGSKYSLPDETFCATSGTFAGSTTELEASLEHTSKLLVSDGQPTVPWDWFGVVLEVVSGSIGGRDPVLVGAADHPSLNCEAGVKGSS